MHATADTENGDYVDDPTEAQPVPGAAYSARHPVGWVPVQSHLPGCCRAEEPRLASPPSWPAIPIRSGGRFPP